MRVETEGDEQSPFPVISNNSHVMLNDSEIQGPQNRPTALHSPPESELDNTISPEQLIQMLSSNGSENNLSEVMINGRSFKLVKDAVNRSHASSLPGQNDRFAST